MRKKIFKACLQLSIGIMIAVSVAAAFIHQFLRTQDEIAHLENFGSIIASAIEKHGIDFLYDHEYSWIRISVIGSDGTMLYDSDFDELKMGNHGDRTEVEHAMNHGKSTISRYSTTLKKQTYYHAIQLDTGDILRLSFTSDSLYLYTRNFTAFLLVLACFLIFSCYYIATLLSRSIIDPINNIKIDDLNSDCNIGRLYPELQPFMRRIIAQKYKIDEQYQELRLKANEFQVITKSMSDGLIVLNAAGNIITINKVARKIFAVTKEDCLNQSYLAIDNFEYLQDMMAAVPDKPRQTRTIMRDGRDYELRFGRIEDNSRCVGYVLIILDITEKKRTEQMRQEFTANVSHELKTPLQSIIGYSEMMANGFVKSEDIRHFSSRINKQSSRLKTLIEDIIFLSQLDEGQVSIMEPISVKQIAKEIFENLEEKASERSVSLKLEGSDLRFIAVNRYIYELIYNLTDNGIRYNKEGGSVTISLQETGNKYLITIADTGIGIASEDQYRIFERFYRVDKSHSRQTGGTGLGLSIVKRVVLYHHGKIRITSTMGAGTTFTITFYKDKLKVLHETNTHRQEALRAEREKEMDISDAITAEQAIENYRIKNKTLPSTENPTSYTATICEDCDSTLSPQEAIEAILETDSDASDTDLNNTDAHNAHTTSHDAHSSNTSGSDSSNVDANSANKAESGRSESGSIESGRTESGSTESGSIESGRTDSVRSAAIADVDKATTADDESALKANASDTAALALDDKPSAMPKGIDSSSEKSTPPHN